MDTHTDIGKCLHAMLNGKCVHSRTHRE